MCLCVSRSFLNLLRYLCISGTVAIVHSHRLGFWETIPLWSAPPSPTRALFYYGDERLCFSRVRRLSVSAWKAGVGWWTDLSFPQHWPLLYRPRIFCVTVCFCCSTSPEHKTALWACYDGDQMTQNTGVRSVILRAEDTSKAFSTVLCVQTGWN